MIKIVTHDGRFHADEIFGVATLLLVLEKKGEGLNKIKIVRTREAEEISSADYVLDVGLIYDANNNKFDHHQLEFTEKHKNEIPLATFGLMWKHFGMELVSSNESWERIDNSLVSTIDAGDNGISLYNSTNTNVHLYSIQSVLASFVEKFDAEGGEFDGYFNNAVTFAKSLLILEIKKSEYIEEVLSNFEPKLNSLINEINGFKVLISDTEVPWRFLKDESYRKFDLIVSKRKDGKWELQLLSKERQSFERNINFPNEWLGKTGDELKSITNLKSALFCHKVGFLFVALDKVDVLTAIKHLTKNY